MFGQMVEFPDANHLVWKDCHTRNFVYLLILLEGRAARAGTGRQTQQHVARILMRVTAVSTQDDLVSTR